MMSNSLWATLSLYDLNGTLASWGNPSRLKWGVTARIAVYTQTEAVSFASYSFVAVTQRLVRALRDSPPFLLQKNYNNWTTNTIKNSDQHWINITKLSLNKLLIIAPGDPAISKTRLFGTWKILVQLLLLRKGFVFPHSKVSCIQ